MRMHSSKLYDKQYCLLVSNDDDAKQTSNRQAKQEGQWKTSMMIHSKQHHETNKKRI